MARPTTTSTNRSIATIAIALFVVAIVAVAVWAIGDRDVEAIGATPAGTSGAPDPGTTTGPAVTATVPATAPEGGRKADQPVATE